MMKQLIAEAAKLHIGGPGSSCPPRYKLCNGDCMPSGGECKPPSGGDCPNGAAKIKCPDGTMQCPGRCMASAPVDDNEVITETRAAIATMRRGTRTQRNTGWNNEFVTPGSPGASGSTTIIVNVGNKKFGEYILSTVENALVEVD